MNLDFSPKRQFQNDAEAANELRTVVNSGRFHNALSAALAEYVYRATPSAEQITAVRQFMAVLMHLPEAEEPPPAFPQRTLDHSIYERGIVRKSNNPVMP